MGSSEENVYRAWGSGLKGLKANLSSWDLICSKQNSLDDILGLVDTINYCLIGQLFALVSNLFVLMGKQVV